MERKDLLPTSEEMGYDKDYICSPDEDNILERLREQLGYRCFRFRVDFDGLP